MRVCQISEEMRPLKLWRYMDAGKFESLIEQRALWFASADSFEDSWEGSYTRRHVEQRESFWDKIGDPEAFREGVRKIAGWNRQATFINCWSMKDEECALMWRAYLNGQSRGCKWRRGRRTGVAVQTTFGRMEKALPDWVLICPVSYIDHDSATMPMDHSLDPFLWKQREFSNEREVRLIIDRFPSGHAQAGHRIHPRGHRTVEVDVDKLIEAVVLSPRSDAAFQSRITRLLHRAALAKPIRPSALLQLPYH